MDKKSKNSSDPWVWISILGFFIALTIFSLNFFEKLEKKTTGEGSPQSSVIEARDRNDFRLC